MVTTPHNQLYRRLRRRIPFYNLWWLVAIAHLTVIVVTCLSLATWSQTGGQTNDLGRALWWMWTAGATAMAALNLICLLTLSLVPAEAIQRKRWTIVIMGISFLLSSASAVALLLHHIALAVCIIFLGGAIVRSMHAVEGKSKSQAILSLLCIVTVFAFLTGAPWQIWTATAVTCGSSPLISLLKGYGPLLKRRLRDALRSKPSRMEYGSKSLATGPMGSIFCNSRQLKSLYEAEMWDEALAALETVKQAGWVRHNYTAYQAAVLTRMGCYEQVLDLAEQDFEGRFPSCTAIALAHTGQQEEALTFARRALSERTTDDKYAMSVVLEQSGDLEGALEWTERAANQMGQRPQMMRRVAQLLMKLEDYLEARIAWEQSIKLLPFVRAEDLEQLAECYRKLGEPEKAEEVESLAATYRIRDQTASTMKC